jgi:transcriptional regulator with XRE-family HTH domain
MNKKKSRYEFDYLKVMKDLRIDSDLTQAQVASILGISQTMYARYERGANEFPIRHLLTLCEYYQVPADYFLGKTDKKDGSS